MDEIMAEINADVKRREAELFGNSNGAHLSDEEFDIVFSARLSHEEKITKLRLIRANKRAKSGIHLV